MEVLNLQTSSDESPKPPEPPRLLGKNSDPVSVFEEFFVQQVEELLTPGTYGPPKSDGSPKSPELPEPPRLLGKNSDHVSVLTSFLCSKLRNIVTKNSFVLSID